MIRKENRIPRERGGLMVESFGAFHRKRNAQQRNCDIVIDSGSELMICLCKIKISEHFNEKCISGSFPDSFFSSGIYFSG